MGFRLGFAGLVAALALLVPSFASAATPGKIAFVSDRVGQTDRDIWVMNGDGSGLLPLTNDNNTFDDRDPSWSPDGKQIAFGSDRDGGSDLDLWVMNADGTGAHQLTNGFETGSVDWAPDGKTLVLTNFETPESNLLIVNADGTGLHQLTFVPTGADAFGGHFSPDGQWIVFTLDGPGSSDDFLTLIKPDGTQQHSINGIDSYAPDFTADGKRIVFYSEQADADGDNEVMSIGADGSDQRQLTFTGVTGGNDSAPSPSRDGLNRIAFRSTRDAEHNYNQQIFVMNADGSGVTQLTHDASGDDNRGPDWQPNVVCHGKVATIVGTSASETLTGGPGADVISGQGGKDTVNGGGGKDTICGDAGKDKLNGQAGKDLLDGGKGNDKENGGKGKDTCIGGKGKHDTAKKCEKEKKIP
jgi:Tol biopolymer transport system component